MNQELSQHNTFLETYFQLKTTFAKAILALISMFSFDASIEWANRKIE
jgi:hypothetical protein